MKKIVLGALALMTIAGTSCLKDDTRPIYLCDNGWPKYMDMKIGNTDYLPDGYATGGTIQFTEATNERRTAIELYIYKDNKKSGILVKMNNIVDVGVYDQSDIYSSKVLVDDVEYEMFNTEMRFTELSEVTNSTQANIMFYGKSAGSYFGQYYNSATSDTVNVEGRFCTDEFPS